MKSKISKTQTKKKIDEFFRRKDFTPKEVRKIKRLAMKHNIKLGGYRKQFCKKCYSRLNGKTKVTKTHKTIICESCGYRNRARLLPKEA